ncbi:PstS family phosphate ABC transporter substrate-binding protein [Sporosarcina sp. E16_8]|nr:PstS family phosphate ABC transporter substrate-binding protein [Sporosarcina sp. E16_8]MBO0587777.1 PstS family phosphate ABC transporter substrate-binding protein [Sporosarcina sp. E16_8]
MGLLLPFTLIGALYVWIAGLLFLLPLLVVLYVSLGTVLFVRMFGKSKHEKVVYRVIIGVVCLSLIVAVPSIYNKTRPIVQDGQVDTSTYEPFGDHTKAVTLTEPSTMKIEENLPIIDGATALYPVYAAFAQAVYPEKKYDQHDSEVMSNRTGAAYSNLINGRADIIFALAPSDQQLAVAKRLGKELKLTPIGKEAFVFFVNEKNPVQSLTEDEIKGIYAGDITNWEAVGGKNKDIRAFQRPDDSGSQTALQHFMGDVPIMDPPVEDIASLMGTVIDQVSDYKNYNNAIGYTFRYYSTEMTKNNAIRLLSVNGAEPTKETIRSRDYPITNELYAVTSGSDNPHVDAFIDWILSEQGQEIIEKTGYVSIK